MGNKENLSVVPVQHPVKFRHKQQCSHSMLCMDQAPLLGLSAALRHLRVVRQEVFIHSCGAFLGLSLNND